MAKTWIYGSIGSISAETMRVTGNTRNKKRGSKNKKKKETVKSKQTKTAYSHIVIVL